MNHKLLIWGLKNVFLRSCSVQLLHFSSKNIQKIQENTKTFFRFFYIFLCDSKTPKLPKSNQIDYSDFVNKQCHPNLFKRPFIGTVVRNALTCIKVYIYVYTPVRSSPAPHEITDGNQIWCE